VTDAPVVTIGDERRVSGWGPMQKVLRCDIEVPSKGLPGATYPLAELVGSPGGGTTYTINIPGGFSGRLERADGTMRAVEEMISHRGPNIEQGDAGGIRYHLQNAETLYLVHNAIVYQVRYVRRAKMIPPPLMETLNYTWMNILVLAFFLHTMAIVSFIATPVTTSELTEDMFKNRNRFAQFRLTPEQQQKQQNLLLSKLKAGEPGAKAKGTEGKAGRKDYDPKKKQGRMAVKGDPNEKEIAKSTLAKLFGGKGNVGRSYLFGSGGLGGELKGALGGVTGAEIGDATGLGGLGTRGTGPGGGGLSMNSVGLGALGTHGRGGGQGGYGEGIGGLGKKVDRDINISAGSPIIMGSLDKEIIRRIIKQHIAQIRYCYEKELVRNPGLFGKVATQFTIAANGSVQSADVSQSTLNNSEVERCITAKIRTWQFPKPKGGGIVIVKYPFIFKTSG
jgi:TonB family protein